MMSPEHALAELADALKLMRILPETLVSDMVLIGFGIDTYQQGAAAIHLESAGMPENGLANARVAFEAAQQAVALVTHPDYATAGIRAWIYFARKDRAIGRLASKSIDADREYDAELERLRAVCEDLHPGRGADFDHVAMSLDKQRRKPDNWLGVDMAEAYDHGITEILESLGKTAPDAVSQKERAAYKALCRSSHARPRLKPNRIVRMADGSLHAEERERRSDLLAKQLHLAVSGSVFDAVLALAYRIAQQPERS